MLNIPDIITLTITPEDAEKANGYGDTRGCLLCSALKRVFPALFPHVGGTSATLETVPLDSIDSGGERKTYWMGPRDADAIYNCYYGDDLNKADRPIVTEPFTITLRHNHES